MNPSLNRFWTILEAISDAFVGAARRAGRAIAAMSWPQIAAASVGLALVLAIVPLALTLFCVFMIIKLAIGAGVVHLRRGRATPYKPVDEEEK
ncbi:MAG: hypothetical protein ACLGI6_07980 [Gammaproteobacteria bacterium]